jgi:hypothetical protein
VRHDSGVLFYRATTLPTWYGMMGVFVYDEFDWIGRGGRCNSFPFSFVLEYD